MRKALSLPGLLLVFPILSWPVLAETAAPVAQQTSDETAIELAFWDTVKDTKDFGDTPDLISTAIRTAPSPDWRAS